VSVDLRLLPAGPRAVLVELASLGAVLALAEELRDDRLGAVTELVPAARTVLVVHDGRHPDEVERWIVSRAAAADPARRHPTSEAVTIDVRYDGADLEPVADLTGLSVDEVIARHSAATYTAAFCGFVPGFAYLVGLDARLHLPRRSTPRPRVPAGSVAIAADLTGVYPSATAGGWHLLGTTDAVMWSDDRDPPALVVPGAVVRFRPT
jgi:KipI family sensor histidine kinase inhibitor